MSIKNTFKLNSLTNKSTFLAWNSLTNHAEIAQDWLTDRIAMLKHRYKIPVLWAYHLQILPYYALYSPV